MRPLHSSLSVRICNPRKYEQPVRALEIKCASSHNHSLCLILPLSRLTSLLCNVQHAEYCSVHAKRLGDPAPISTDYI